MIIEGNSMYLCIYILYFYVRIYFLNFKLNSDKNIL